MPEGWPAYGIIGRVTISARELNRATLGRQLLLAREPVGVVDAVQRLVVLQAQNPPSPYVALWNRLAGFDPAELDTAFAAGTVVKSKVVRMTLHAHLPSEYEAFRNAVQPSFRANGLNDRFRASGLTADDVDELFAKLLPFVAVPRTSEEIKAWLADRTGKPVHAGLWRAVVFVAPLLHAPTGPPWSFGPRTSFVAAGTPAEPADPQACAAGLQTLAVRYLEGFGPASVADIAQFAMVQRARARAAVEALGDRLEQLRADDGTVLYDVPGGLRPDADTEAPPRLLGMWDIALLAYADRSRMVPPEIRPLIARSNGDVLPTLLVDGQVAGVWRATDAGIEATAFRPISDEAWQQLAAEASDLAALLRDRDPLAYRRYHHWWGKLPDGEERLLYAY